MYRWLDGNLRFRTVIQIELANLSLIGENTSTSISGG